MEFMGVPVVSQPAAKAMEKVGGPAKPKDGLHQAAMEKMWQRRNQPKGKLHKAPTMDRNAMKSFGFSEKAYASHKAAQEGGMSGISSQLKSLGKSLSNLWKSKYSVYDLSTPFGQISDAVASCMKTPDDVELARTLCKLTGDLIEAHPELDVQIAVKLEGCVFVAIVDAVMASYCEHNDDVEVQRWGTYAIWKLAARNKSHAQYLSSLGVQDTIEASKEMVAEAGGDSYEQPALKALADAAA